YISDFSKSRILSQLKKYTVAGISQKLIDLKILYVELDISAYYNYSQISTEDTLKSKIINSLTKYSQSVNFNRFGGRFKYSKVLQVIDKTDTALTSNITKIIIRRDLKATVNQFAQYELCFGNRFHVDPNGYNIKSTGFFIAGESSPVYITDIPNADGETGVLSIVKPIENGEIRVVSKSAGVVDYIHGEVKLTTINILSTVKENNIIEIQAFPESNDVVGLRDLYLELSV
ncbi:MAG: baseplate wedge protein, partial [Pseudomonadota bacterium]|nr:baseplate wedge protein [Pseudomonadota bacterium]